MTYQHIGGGWECVDAWPWWAGETYPWPVELFSMTECWEADRHDQMREDWLAYHAARARVRVDAAGVQGAWRSHLTALTGRSMR